MTFWCSWNFHNTNITTASKKIFFFRLRLDFARQSNTTICLCINCTQFHLATIHENFTHSLRGIWKHTQKILMCLYLLLFVVLIMLLGRGYLLELTTCSTVHPCLRMRAWPWSKSGGSGINIKVCVCVCVCVHCTLYPQTSSHKGSFDNPIALNHYNGGLQQHTDLFTTRHLLHVTCNM